MQTDKEFCVELGSVYKAVVFEKEAKFWMARQGQVEIACQMMQPKLYFWWVVNQMP